MIDIDTLVLQQAAQWQRDGVPAWLVTVARTWGSSPRPPGALMALNVHGDVAGSVSGGCIEDDLVARVRAGAASTTRPEVLRYGVHADQARQFGLPCGGTLDPVSYTHLDVYKRQGWRAIGSIAARKSSVMHSPTLDQRLSLSLK